MHECVRVRFNFIICEPISTYKKLLIFLVFLFFRYVNISASFGKTTYFMSKYVKFKSLIQKIGKIDELLRMEKC